MSSTGIEDRQAAQELIDWLLDHYSISEDGRVTSPGKVSITLAERELAAIAGQDVSSTEVKRAIGRAKIDGSPEVDCFAAKLDEVLRGNSDSPWKEWMFLLPLHNQRIENHKRIELRIYGQYFSIIGQEQAEEILDHDLHQKALRRLLKRGRFHEKAPKYYLAAKRYGDCWRSAWNQLESSFYTLMGYLEFSFSAGRHQIIGVNIRAQIPHPDWMIRRSDTGDIGSAFFITHKNRKSGIHKLESKNLEYLQYRSKFLREVPKSSETTSLLADSFRLYYQAMNRLHKYACFLGFWQTLESVVLSQDINGDTEAIIDRAEWYTNVLDQPGSGMRYILGALAYKRNDIVHHGFIEVSNEDINLLKIVCDLAIRWVVNNLDKVATKDNLRAQYEIRSAEKKKAKAEERLS